MVDNTTQESGAGRSAPTSLTRRRFVAAGTAASAGLLSGCTSGRDESQNGQPSTGNNSSGGGGGETFSAEVTVTHWPILMYAPPYQMALENGYFEEEGLDVTSVVGSSGGGTTVRNVVTGGLPFGEVATPAAVNAYYAGAPLSIVAGATNSPGTINWVAPKGSPVESMTDLKGKTVGYTSAGSVTQNTSALAVKYADGIDVDDVEFNAMGGVSEGLTAVSEGAIAAAANLDPIFSNQQQEDRWQVVFWAKDYITTFQQTCVIAGPKIVEERPDAIRGFLRARARGVEFIRQNPEEAAGIFASYNDGYEAGVMREAFRNVEPESYYTTNEFSVEGLKRIEEGMHNIDLIDRPVEWTKIATQEFIPEERHVDLSAAEQ